MKVVKFTVYFSYSVKPIDILDSELASLYITAVSKFWSCLVVARPYRKNPQQR